MLAFCAIESSDWSIFSHCGMITVPGKITRLRYFGVTHGAVAATLLAGFGQMGRKVGAGSSLEDK
jgi:hypothetical protein